MDGIRYTTGTVRHKAVVLGVKEYLVTFYKCRMHGYQDSLFVQTHRQFYSHCIVSSTVNFIFGDAAVVLQFWPLPSASPSQPGLHHHHRADRYESTCIVIHGCCILPASDLFAGRFHTKMYLSRPWMEHARTVIMESTIGDLIAASLGTATLLSTLSLLRRVWQPWRGWPGMKVITRREALKETVGSFMQGNA